MDLSKFNNDWYRPGRGRLTIFLWMLLGQPILGCSILPFGFLKRFVLKLFGAKLGQGVVIKPSVIVKYPWRLSIGDHCWIGEGVWIDSLDDVRIGNNVCVSQGAYLCTGSHDAAKNDFPLLVAPIVLEDQSWVCAKATVLQGVTLKEGAVLTAGGVATRGELDAWTFYGGVPAKAIGPRSDSSQEG